MYPPARGFSPHPRTASAASKGLLLLCSRCCHWTSGAGHHSSSGVACRVSRVGFGVSGLGTFFQSVVSLCHRFSNPLPPSLPPSLSLSLSLPPSLSLSPSLPPSLPLSLPPSLPPSLPLSPTSTKLYLARQWSRLRLSYAYRYMARIAKIHGSYRDA
jgi:hypothetical protein